MKATLVIETFDAGGFVSGWCAINSPKPSGVLQIAIARFGHTLHQFSTGIARSDLGGEQGFETHFPLAISVDDVILGNIEVSLLSHPECQVECYVIGDAGEEAQSQSTDTAPERWAPSEPDGCSDYPINSGDQTRHAVLILAHSQPKVLARALQVYARLGWHVYIHVDAKIDVNDYVSRVGTPPSDTVFLAERTAVYWMGFSMVEATLALIKAAKQSGVPYTRMTLLSDDALPIWAEPRLASWAASDATWIELRRHVPGDLGWQRYNGFYYWDHATTARRRIDEQPEVDDQMIAAIRELGELKAKGKKDIEIWSGSQWWSMTAEDVEGVMEEIDNDPHLYASFRFSEVPDESFFHTITAARSSNIFYRGVCFVDWEGPPYPKVFSTESVLPPESNDYPFARKFCTTDDEGGATESKGT